jgi:hypothetical protein
MELSLTLNFWRRVSEILAAVVSLGSIDATRLCLHAATLFVVPALFDLGGEGGRGGGCGQAAVAAGARQGASLGERRAVGAHLEMGSW